MAKQQSAEVTVEHEGGDAWAYLKFDVPVRLRSQGGDAWAYLKFDVPVRLRSQAGDKMTDTVESVDGVVEAFWEDHRTIRALLVRRVASKPKSEPVVQAILQALEVRQNGKTKHRRN